MQFNDRGTALYSPPSAASSSASITMRGLRGVAAQRCLRRRTPAVAAAPAAAAPVPAGDIVADARISGNYIRQLAIQNRNWAMAAAKTSTTPVHLRHIAFPSQLGHKRKPQQQTDSLLGSTTRPAAQASGDGSTVILTLTPELELQEVNTPASGQAKRSSTNAAGRPNAGRSVEAPPRLHRISSRYTTHAPPKARQQQSKARFVEPSKEHALAGASSADNQADVFGEYLLHASKSDDEDSQQYGSGPRVIASTLTSVEYVKMVKGPRKQSFDSQQAPQGEDQATEASVNRQQVGKARGLNSSHISASAKRRVNAAGKEDSTRVDLSKLAPQGPVVASKDAPWPQRKSCKVYQPHIRHVMCAVMGTPPPQEVQQGQAGHAQPNAAADASNGVSGSVSSASSVSSRSGMSSGSAMEREISRRARDEATRERIRGILPVS